MLHLLSFLITGAIVGWLAGLLLRGRGFGLGWNMAIGVAGALIGKFVTGIAGLSAHNWIGRVATGLVGAFFLFWLVSRMRQKR